MKKDKKNLFILIIVIICVIVLIEQRTQTIGFENTIFESERNGNEYEYFKIYTKINSGSQ